jgi:hypothetical protein
MAEKMTVQLQPSSLRCGTFRERLEKGRAAIADDVELKVVAVVVTLTPVADDRPDAVKLRLALKQLGRWHGLRAKWTAPPIRPKPNAKRKRKGPRNASQSPGEASGEDRKAA